jgi:outer membrane protein
MRLLQITLLVISILVILPGEIINAYGTNGPGSAPESEPLRISYREALEYAVEHSTEMRTARIDVDIAGRNQWEITASGLPQIDASTNYQYNFRIPTQLVPAEFFGGEPGEFVEVQFGTKQNLIASATVSQLVFDGSYIVGLRAARIYRELTLHTLQRSELEVRNRVSETYFVVLLSRDNLSIVRDNLANMEQTLYETREIYEAGFTDQINLDQLRLSVSNMQNRVQNMERQYEISKNLLKFQIGYDIDNDIELTDSLEELFNRMLIEADTGPDDDFDYEEHIDYKVMLSRQIMDYMAFRRQQSFFLPSLTASYTWQQMAMRDEFNFTDRSRPWYPSSFLAVTLNIPIFSSGLRSARVQEARLELHKSELATHQVSQSLKLQIAEARSRFSNAREQYDSERENLLLAEKILRQTKIMHREGMATSLELTQASNQLLETQSNYYNAMFEFINAKNDLDKARGI